MAPDQAAPIPAGWYPDPYSVAELRWWDGQNWTDSTHPPVAPVQASAPPAVAQPVPAEQPASFDEPTPQDPQQWQTPVPAVQAVTDPNLLTPAPSVPGVNVSVPADFPAPTSPPLNMPDPSPSVPAVPVPAVPVPAVPVPAVPELVAPESSLPSRRDLRARSHDATTTPEVQQPGPIADSPNLTPQEHVTSGFPPPGSVIPSASTPSAFDWLPGGNSGSIPQPAAPTASTPEPSAAAIPSANTGEFASAASLFGSDRPATSGPPLGSDPWARQSTLSAPNNSGVNRPTGMRRNTVSGWFIALTPLITALLLVAVVKGSENYPKYIPIKLDWWIWAGGIAAIIYLITILFAVSDRRKLEWAGYQNPAHWAWAALTAPIYLLVRMISIKKESGRLSVLLFIWILSVLVLVGAWFAAQNFAPELISGYTLPFL